ncbi:DNA mismatch repair ATPase msh1, partial [Perkinsus olseni]
MLSLESNELGFLSPSRRAAGGSGSLLDFTLDGKRRRPKWVAWLGDSIAASIVSPLFARTSQSEASARGQKGSWQIQLVRCGDFYKTYGVDAVMLVNYCGLNAMAGRPRAGC